MMETNNANERNQTLNIFMEATDGATVLDTSPLEIDEQFSAPSGTIPDVPKPTNLDKYLESVDLDNHPEMQRVLGTIESELLHTLQVLAAGTLEPVAQERDDHRRVSWRATAIPAVETSDSPNKMKEEILHIVRDMQKSSHVDPQSLFALSRSLMKCQGHDRRIASLSQALMTALSHVDALGELFTRANEGRICAKEALRVRMSNPVAATATLAGTQAAGIARQATLTKMNHKQTHAYFPIIGIPSTIKANKSVNVSEVSLHLFGSRGI